ncbi:MAG: hypothetical protein JSS77_12965 [Acidobacteria bacterium]|nr:hypothetical protein [Acidobacteriota bacterium]
MGKQRVLITVKTYPTLSRKHGETVCTAGMREDGSWVRIYPVPFRRLDDKEQYSKYDWVECQLARNSSDPRPETFRPVDQHELVPTAHMDTADNWRDRRNLLLRTARVYDKLDELIAAAKANEVSLAVFKPTQLIDFVVEEDEREWDLDKVREMREASKQNELFEDNTWRETFKVIPKLPYCFSYKFKDASGRQSQLQILDWEIGALYWNCLRSTGGDEPKALEKVRRKFMDEFQTKDLHFFLGTTQQFHFVAPNPWVIIGVLPIPHEVQLGLL